MAIINNYHNLLSSKSTRIQNIFKALEIIWRVNYPTYFQTSLLNLYRIYERYITLLNRPDNEITLNAAINIIDNFMLENNIQRRARSNATILDQFFNLIQDKPYMALLFFEALPRIQYLMEVGMTHASTLTLEQQQQIVVNFLNTANENTTTEDIENYIRNYLISQNITIPPSPFTAIPAPEPLPSSQTPIVASQVLVPEAAENEISGGSKNTRKYKKHKKTRRIKDKISKRRTKYVNKGNLD
jgi:hypothetical protein